MKLCAGMSFATALVSLLGEDVALLLMVNPRHAQGMVTSPLPHRIRLALRHLRWPELRYHFDSDAAIAKWAELERATLEREDTAKPARSPVRCARAVPSAASSASLAEAVKRRPSQPAGPPVDRLGVAMAIDRMRRGKKGFAA